MTAEAGGTPVEIAGPVRQGERISALDTLRGVAVLGILVMNIYAFAMPFAAYMNPLLLGGTEWYNLGTWFMTHVLADQKFMTIFSMLFGGGMVLMWERAAARGVPFGRIYYRRMFWLLLIGMAHGYLVWFGDILFHYALMGMLIYPLRRWRPRSLIILACLLLPIAPLMSYGGYFYMSDLQERAAEYSQMQEAGETLDEEQQAAVDEWNVLRGFMSPDDDVIQEDLEAHRGGYLDIVQHRAPLVVSMQLQNTVWFMLWRVGGVMLLGMALMKLGVLTGKRSGRFYRNLLLVGYGLGLPVMLYSSVDLYAHEFAGLYFMKQGGIPNYVGSILVALGHIGLVMRLVQAGVFRNLARRFAAVGRMALTNYLMHSIVMTTIFYGYGFGLYGEIPRAAQMLFVFGLVGVQLAISPVWLQHFRFGPVEWLWRSLTYWRRQPMRQAA
ncbi:MAG: DUF418 domain-containing protein [Woeseiaceae bacterium]|nr:DUF418 domain-containing protein [Woeseiaceae bacterium]